MATANLVGPALRHARPDERVLARVQHRRLLPTRITRAFQTAVLRDLYPEDPGDDTAARTADLLRVPLLRAACGWRP
ncbi:hypothetical protein ACSNOB_10535 [Micromonospora sp. URMC 106]|uniref:hypothetical protein n=1 Tax=Micromonospora sp. URMC 106 TaxID=3423408 RepID=UPI003F19F640